MQDWTGEAISIFARKHSENDAILEIFSKDNGRINGYVFGGASKKKKSYLEPGQIINIDYKVKIRGALGSIERMEYLHSIESILSDSAAIYALNSITSLLHDVLPENQKFEFLYEATKILIMNLGQDINWPAAFIKWETGLLSQTGFGLDLTECALTGEKENLYWVSPKTGRAATYDAGLPFKDKLLKLPQFLINPNSEILSGDVADGFALNAWFLERDLLSQSYKTLPEARARLIYALGRTNRL